MQHERSLKLVLCKGKALTSLGFCTKKETRLQCDTVASLLTLQPVTLPKAPNVCRSICMVTAGCSLRTIRTRLSLSSGLHAQNAMAGVPQVKLAAAQDGS